VGLILAESMLALLVFKAGYMGSYRNAEMATPVDRTISSEEHLLVVIMQLLLWLEDYWPAATGSDLSRTSR
jgi:hypothetical protein